MRLIIFIRFILLSSNFIANELSTDLVGLCRRTVVQSHSKCDSNRRLLLKRFPHQPWDTLSPSTFILGRAGVICRERVRQINKVHIEGNMVMLVIYIWHLYHNSMDLNAGYCSVFLI